MAIKKGITTPEVLVAMVIFTIIMVTAFLVMGNIHIEQKKLEVSQDFYTESRFLMERIVQMGRNNTIDYDRYFKKSGPPLPPPGQNSCGNFKSNQVPSPCTTGNNETNRTCLGYSNIFYWDSGNGKARNMGGLTNIGAEDPCTQAWYTSSGTVNDLYLINSDRDMQTAIKLDSNNQIVLEQRLGVDTNGDGKVDDDGWTPYSQFSGGNCHLYSNAGKTTEITSMIGDTTSEELCNEAHDWIPISQQGIKVTDLFFIPSPNRDPYLAFRIYNQNNDPSKSDAQIQPHVLIRFNAELANPAHYGLDPNGSPNITLQTSVSSRVYGDTRK